MKDDVLSKINRLCKEKIVGIYGGIDLDTKEPYCVVDFRRKNWSANIDCDDYCRETIELFARDECSEDDEGCWERLEKECINECEDNVRRILTRSIEFDPVTLRVKSARIAKTCGAAKKNLLKI